MSREREAYKQTVRDHMEHQRRSGRPVTEREAEKFIRPIAEKADREQSEKKR